MSELAGRRALVTGGAVRLGRALCLALAAAGLDVAVHYRSSARAAEETVAACREHGVRALAVPADLAEREAPARLVSEVEEALGPIDVLVNSAANFVSRDFAAIEERDLDLALTVNLKAPFLLAQAVAPGMADRGFGRIVNMADVAGLEPWPRFVAHSVAKAGLVMLTRSLAQALAPHITVNAIAPGAVLMPDGTGPDAVARSEAKTVLGRIGAPEDAAGALVYLLGAEYVTGHVLVVDGGRLVRP